MANKYDTVRYPSVGLISTYIPVPPFLSPSDGIQVSLWET